MLGRDGEIVFGEEDLYDYVGIDFWRKVDKKGIYVVVCFLYIICWFWSSILIL